MTKEEALELLKTAPQSNKSSKVNPGLTEAHVTEIVREGLPDGDLSRLFEKRVWQAVKNQKRPSFEYSRDSYFP